MATNYYVYIGAKSTIESFDSTETLADVRKALTAKGLMTTTDAFLYENEATSLKTVYAPQSAEKNHPVSLATFPAVASLSEDYELIQIVSTSATSPSFLGDSPADNYFRPIPQFGVSVSLNMSDPAAKVINKDMFEPVLLESVQSSNPDAPISFSNCVIVQKGAVVSFDVSSWGAAGWGLIIDAAETTSTSICPGIFITYDNDNFGSIETTTLDRYVGNATKSGDTIQIESNASLKLGSQYNVAYSTITVKTFSLSEWTDSSGKVYSSSLQIPSSTSETLDDKGNVAPPPPSGQSDVPSNSVGSGTPVSGPKSKQTFGGISSVRPTSCPATRSSGLVDQIEIYFLVFDSKADADTVIKVLNKGTMHI